MTKKKKIVMPAPECELGYPDSQICSIMGERYNEFMRWMNGQTMALCDGRSYDYASQSYKLTGCGPHGGVVYSGDVQRFLEGHPIID